MNNSVQPLLSINGLNTAFKSDKGMLPALQGVTLSIDRGSVLSVVGESGSGKSLTALSVMRLIPPPGVIVSGQIIFDGEDLTRLNDSQMRAIRGQRISMIFQEPMTSLNPVLRIGDQVIEPLILHKKISRNDATAFGIDLLSRVGIPSAESRIRDYPHQLSGGMRQRVMIAMALACKPELLIADEPTTALDTTIQAQILELLDEQRKSSGLSMLLISHDLGIVAERSDFTCVMYAGQVVESAPTRKLISNPRHPYTKALLDSLPQNAIPGKPLKTMPGQPSILTLQKSGCGFCDRCPSGSSECRTGSPPYDEISPGHFVRCWKHL